MDSSTIQKGSKALHPTLGLVRVLAVTQHPEGHQVARVVDARQASNRGGIWTRLDALEVQA